jgi:hypothetical protein
MFEKLVLAVTITFSLNLFLQVRVHNQTEVDASYQHPRHTSPTILVKIHNK